AAHTLAVEPALLGKLHGEIGLRQRGPADADEGDAPIPQIRGSRLKEKLLQVTIAAAHHWYVRNSALHLFGQAKMPVDANQRMRGCLVPIRRRILEWPNDVRHGVGISHANVHERDSELCHFTNPSYWFVQVRNPRIIVARSPNCCSRSR